MRTVHFTSIFVVMLMANCLTTQAAIKTANVFLDGLQEVPPVATPATGSAAVTFDTVTGAMSVSGTFSDLIGTSIAAHVHGYQPAGVLAGVVFGINYDMGVNSGTFSGNGIIPAIRIMDVLNGLTYINIHSTFKPGGEIRGQIVNFVPEPATLAFAVSGIGLALMRRNRRHR